MYNFVASNNGRSLSESVFFASNATPGTGIASVDAETAYDDEAALMTIYNSASASANPGENQWIVPVSLRLTATAVNTSASNFKLVGDLSATNRYTSGGTTLTSSSCSTDTRSGYTNRTPKATINFGSVVTTADTSPQRVFNTLVNPVIFAVDDTIEIIFGGVGSANNVSGTAARNSINVPMVWIGRGSTLAIHGFGTSQAADPAFEVEFTYIETGHPRFNS